MSRTIFRFGRLRLRVAYPSISPIRRGVRRWIARGPVGPSFCLRLTWGRGAGYIGGFTAYFAMNCRDCRPMRYHFYRRLQVGVTRNANIVPIPARYC